MKLIRLIIMGGLLLSCHGNYVVAAVFNVLSDTLSAQKINLGSDHIIKWQTTVGINAPAETISIIWPVGFDLTTVNLADVDLSYGPITGQENIASLAPVAGIDIWGASWLGNTLVLSSPTNTWAGYIAVGNYIKVMVGRVAVGGQNQIKNPALAGNYVINVNQSNGEHGQTGIAIVNNNNVTISAQVPALVAPVPAGGGVYWVEPDVKPPTVNAQLRPTYLPVVKLYGEKEKINDVRVNNSLTGISYPTEYTWETTRLLAIGDNVFYLYSQDTLTQKNSQLISAVFVRRIIGDTDGDMDVDDFDLAGVAGHWLYDWWPGDFEENGIVNDFDLAGLAAHWTGEK